MARLGATMNAAVEWPAIETVRVLFDFTSEGSAPVTIILALESAFPLLYSIYFACFLLSLPTRDLLLHLPTITSHIVPDIARFASTRVANVSARMCATS